MSAGGHGLTAVLFTDWVASTQLRAELGPDAADALRRDHDSALTRAVERHGGHVVKGQGDGIMATFPSTVDAADAAVTMQQSIARLGRKSEVELRIRVGISVGDVSFEGDDCFGEPVIEAARLCDKAAPGQILCADLVPALSRGRGGHVFASVGTLELKGFADPVPVTELRWEPATAELPLPHVIAQAYGPIDFVGRETELTELATARKQTDDGAPRLVLLSGEPGMGKTRLVSEFALRSHAEGVLVLAGRCDEDLGVPYQPFVEALRHFVAHCPPDDVVERLGRWGGELARLVPELADDVPDLDEPLRSDPEIERYRLLEAVAHWLAAASRDGGLLLVLDDLHWAAKPTLLMMRHLLRSDAGGRLLIVGTYRQTDLDRAHPLAQVLAELRNDGSVTRVALDGLDLDGIQALMESAAGHDLDDEGLQLAVAVHRETNGLPLFVQQVLAHLAESGAIVQQDGRWVGAVSLDEIGLPEGVREVIGLRLARLSADTNALIAAAAVIGQDVPHDLLRAVSDLDDAEFDAALTEATDPGLLAETDGGAIGYRFTHALVRATLLDELSTARRVAMHRKVGEAVEGIHGDSDRWISTLAHHFSEAAPGGDVDRAVAYRLRAAQHALAQHAVDEAITHFEAGLALLDDLEHDDDESRFELLVGLGVAHLRTLDDRWLDAHQAAAEVARRLGGGDRIVRVALAGDPEGSLATPNDAWTEVIDGALDVVGDEPSTERLRLLIIRGKTLGFGAMAPFIADRSDELQRCLEAADDPHQLVDATYWTRPWSSVDESDDQLERIVALDDRVTDPRRRIKLEIAKHERSLSHGDLAGADRAVAAISELAADLTDDMRFYGGLVRASTAQLHGDLETSQAEYRANAALFVDLPEVQQLIAIQIGFALYDTGELGALAEVMLSQVVSRFTTPAPVVGLHDIGRPDDARRLYESAVDDRLAHPPLALLGDDLAWAEATYRLGDSARAPGAYERLVPYVDRIGSIGLVYVWGSVHRALGMLAATSGEFDRALDHYADAVAVHERLDAPILLARTEVDAAAARLRRGAAGDEDEARRLLTRAIERTEPLGAFGVVNNARALLTTR